MSSARKQHLAIAKNEALWSTLARKEGFSNYKIAKRCQKEGKHILARSYAQEAMWDLKWANKRRKIAISERKKAKKR